MIITLGFIAVIVKIGIIQTSERNRWMQIAQQQVKTNQPIRAVRGNILDRDDRILAASMPKYLVYMDCGVEPLHRGGDTLFTRHISDLSQQLSRIIGDKSAAEYRTLITDAHRKHKRNLRLSKQRINYLQRKEIEKIALVKKGKNTSGITFDEKKLRIKPFDQLAARTIGNVNMQTGRGATGLEAHYNHELSGKDGISTRQRVAGRFENITIIPAEDGCDIRTTLDANLQDLTEGILHRHTSHCSADWGCAILMETQTGRIRAIANLDRSTDGTYYEGDNHAVQRVEPGSTFKTMALMAALEDGKIHIDDTIEVTKAPWIYLKSRHFDAHPKDTVLTVRSALAISSNIALAKIITQAYEGSAEKFVKRIQRLVPTDSLLSDLSGAQRARIEIPKDATTISKMSYGYSVELTPLQILTFYNAIANHGHMVKPYLVSDILREDKVIRHFDTELIRNQICSQSVLHDIQGALHDVVWHNGIGTASRNRWGSRKAQSDIVSIAGKTGTAQLLINGRYSGQDHRMTFVGYFPEEDPRFTCLVMINHPHNKGLYDAGLDCGTAVREIAEQVMAQSTYYTLHKGEKTLHTR